MSGDQDCFDDWEKMAEEIEEQEKNKPAEKEAKETKQNIKEQKPKLTAKQILTNKINQIKNLKEEEFKQLTKSFSQQQNEVIKSQKPMILTQQKDFVQFGKQTGSILKDLIDDETKTLDDTKLATFFQEMLLYSYDGLQWINMHQIIGKIKILKKQRQTMETKLKKQAAKKERQKKQENLRESQSQPSQKQLSGAKVKEDDLFGGAGFIDRKEAKKAQQIEKPAQDDDDFW